VAGTLGDQIFFFAGKHFGRPLLLRWPSLAAATERVQGLLRRYDAWLIVGVRFMYGIRIAGPIIIGASGVPAARFLGFNLLGAAIWAPLIAAIGYVFGHSLEWLVDDLAGYEGLAMALIVATAIGVALIHRARAVRARARPHP
jgi:membrane protein DedA with SNARE-associated domain